MTRFDQTCSIVHDSSNFIFFNNRAFSRLKLQAWDEAINDCLKSIELMPANMKAYYYLAQAQIQLRHPNEGLSSALTAYGLCLRAGNSGDASSISALVLRAKKEKWEAREKDRLRRQSELLAELEDRLEMARRAEVDSIQNRAISGELDARDATEEVQIANELSTRKIDELKSIFAVADPKNMQKRVSDGHASSKRQQMLIQRQDVPDYLIDNISFAIMHDPVVVRSSARVQNSFGLFI